jgi:hypothetical protein
LNFKKSKIIALLCFPILLISFQNCTKLAIFSSESDYIQIASSRLNGGNGGGYEGKPDGFYYRFVPGFTCQGKETYKDRIEFNGNKIYLLENKPNLCATQVRELENSEVVLSISDSGIVIFNNSIYTKFLIPPDVIPLALNEILCRDNFENASLEISAEFNQTQNKTITRLSLFENSSIKNSIDGSSIRSISNLQVHYSAFTSDLKFEVYLDQPISGQSQKYLGRITQVGGSLTNKINPINLTCVLGSYAEPKLKFTGNSDAASPASTRIFKQAMGIWNLTGDCDPSQGPVTISGEAIDTTVTTACGPDGTFTQNIQYSGGSPKIQFDAVLNINYPQILAQQGVSQAVTRLYALPSEKTALLVGTATELQGITMNGFDLDWNRIIVLTNDIDLASMSPTNNFVRLAAGDTFDRNHFFSTIYGDSRLIKNLNMVSGASANSSNPSILGYANAIGIFDLHIRNAKIASNQSNVGAIAGTARQIVAKRLSVTGDISSTGSNVGGLFGNGWDPKIYQSWFNGAVVGNNNVGGIVGYFWDDFIVDSWSSGTVTSTTGAAGGLVGYLFPGNGFAYIANSYSTSSVKGLGGIGGLIGYVNCSIGCISNPRDSFSAGTVTNTTSNPTGIEYVGPAVGANVDSNGVTNSGVNFTQLFSLNTALCMNCTSESLAYSTTKTWAELNTFAQNNWDFGETWKYSLNVNGEPPVLRYNP